MTRARDLADSADKDIAGTLTLDGLTVDGNVGIGTTSPDTQLVIANSTDTLKSNLDSDSIDIFASGKTFNLGTTSNNVFRFFENNSEAMRITGGNVGIGTSSPSDKLHIGGSVGHLKLKSSGAEIEFTRNGPSVLTASDANGYLIFQTGGLNERMRIDSSGNVGIGSSSLDALEARSSFNYKSLRVQNFNINAGDSNYGFIGQNIYQDTAGQTKYIDSGYSSSIHFWGDAMQFHMGTGSADATQSNTEKLRMVQNGNMQQFKQTHYGYTYSTNNGYIDTDFTAADGYIFEISGFVNPNSGGSTYRDVFHGHIYIGHGWSGSALTHYVYFVMDTPPARDIYNSGSSASGNDIDVVIHNNGTETTSVPQSDSSNWNIRLKAFNYNTSLGSQFTLNITRKL